MKVVLIVMVIIALLALLLYTLSNKPKPKPKPKNTGVMRVSQLVEDIMKTASESEDTTSMTNVVPK